MERRIKWLGWLYSGQRGGTTCRISKDDIRGGGQFMDEGCRGAMQF